MTRSFSNRIAQGVPVVGTWISLGSPTVTELASEFDFDWLLFDLEHGCFAESDLVDNLRTIKNPQTAAIVRAPSHDASTIGRILDRGAHGIMVPHVVSSKEAEAIVAAVHYPTRGKRGYSRSVRAYGYGLKAPSDPTAFECVCMAQIESLAGVKNADAIAAVDGIDVLFVGPADLTHDLSARQGPEKYEECLGHVVQAARNHGKQAGILVRNSKDISILQKMGFTILAVDSDLGLLRHSYQQTKNAIRENLLKI